MCGSGERTGQGRGGCQPLSPGWLGCYSTCLELEIFVQSLFLTPSPRPKMHWLFFFFFLHSGSCGPSPCLVDAKDGGATMTWQAGVSLLPLPTGSSDLLFPPTRGALPFKLCSASNLPEPLSGYSKFQGVAWEHRLQTKSWTRRKQVWPLTSAPTPPPASWVVLGAIT